jgi:predicted transcriptional regulator
MLAQQLSQAEIDAAADEAEDDEAMADYQAGRVISHKAVMAWIKSWGTPDELPSPQIGD